MPVSREQVEHVARLARLGLTEAETERMTRELSTVLEHVDLLSEVDTTGVEPVGAAIAMENVMRADETAPSWPVEMVLANAPLRRDAFFEVQAILE